MTPPGPPSPTGDIVLQLSVVLCLEKCGIAPSLKCSSTSSHVRESDCRVDDVMGSTSAPAASTKLMARALRRVAGQRDCLTISVRQTAHKHRDESDRTSLPRPAIYSNMMVRAQSMNISSIITGDARPSVAGLLCIVKSIRTATSAIADRWILNYGALFLAGDQPIDLIRCKTSAYASPSRSVEIS